MTKMSVRPALAALGASVLAVGLPVPASAVIGGYVAGADQFPWTVSVQKDDAHACGGSIYNGRTVITSAMCVRGMAPGQLAVRYGSLTQGFGGTVVGVEKIVLHPRYDDTTRDNDIAVLHTASNITFGPNARPVCLPEQGNDPAEGATAQVSGWGATYEAGPTPSQLMAVDLPIVARAKGRGQYGAAAVTDNMIATGIDAGGKSPGPGDEGGPLVIRDGNDKATLVGVYSWAGGSARPDHAAIFTRVGGEVRTFIADNIRGANDAGVPANAPCGGSR